MAGPPDLTRAIAYRGIALNTVADTLTSGQTTIAGCQVDMFDLSDLEIRQFGEAMALADGIDVGGVWLGARRVAMRGTVYDASRGEAYARIAARYGPIPLALRGLNAFPNLRRPRVVWLGVSADPKLELLHHDVEAACAELGHPLAGRTYRPHVTLGSGPAPCSTPSARLTQASRRRGLIVRRGGANASARILLPKERSRQWCPVTSVACGSRRRAGSSRR